MRSVLAAALVAAVALLVFYPLMKPPILGLADNGDFGRISLEWELQSPPADEYHYAPRLFERVEGHGWTSGFWSSEYVLARTAMALDDVAFERGPRFDIRALGMVHGLLFLAAFAVLFPLCLRLSPARAAMVAAAMILVLCDFSATSYLNTFYMDAPAFVCALLASALLLHASIAPGWFPCLSLLSARLK